MDYEVKYAEGARVVKEKVENVVNVEKSALTIEFMGEEGAMLIVNNRDFMGARKIDSIDKGLRESNIPCAGGWYEKAEVVNLNFGQAIEALKSGKKVARKGWNGKGMFVYYVPAASYPPATDAMKSAFGGGEVPYREYLALKTAQNDVATWSPSTSDALAEDWEVVE